MEVKRDLYNHSGKLQLLVQRVPDWSFSEQNSKDIHIFYEELVLENLSKVRIHLYLTKLKELMRILPKNICDYTKDDVRQLIFSLKEKNSATETVKLYLITLKKFFTRVYKNIPDFLKEIKLKSDKKEYMKKLLTYEDAEKLSHQAQNLRDKAIPCVLYESGARIGEFLNLRKKDVLFDKFGCIINVNGKTGQRPIRLVYSSPMFANYINTELTAYSDVNFIWTVTRGRRRGTPMCYRRIVKLLFNLARNAQIHKPVNPHHFRHSRATELAKLLTDRELCQFFGWAKGSDMPSFYSHLSGRDIHDKILSIYGITQKEDALPKPKQCPRCDFINDKKAKFCCKCSAILDVETAQKVMEQSKKPEMVMEQLLQDPEIKEMMVRKMQELNVKI